MRVKKIVFPFEYDLKICNIKFLGFYLGILILFLGCQQKPTLVTTESQSVLSQEPSVRKMILPKTVIVDVRSDFDFGLNHIPGSVHIKWTDFSPAENQKSGGLEPDKFKLARFLARIGVHPDDPVVVVGQGLKGSAEEGRVAWTLKLLGIKDVQILNYDLLRSQVPRQDEKSPPAKSLWTPEIIDSYEIDFSDFVTLLKAHKVDFSLSPELKSKLVPTKAGHRVGRKILDGNLVLLDCQEHPGVALDLMGKFKGLKIINISWKEFINQQGQVSHTVVPKLKSAGLSPEDMIIVLSHRGLSAGLVSYALHELGYKKAPNFSLGAEYFLNSEKPANAVLPLSL